MFSEDTLTGCQVGTILPPQLYLHSYAAKLERWMKRKSINQDNRNIWPLAISHNIPTTLKFSISKNVHIERLRFFSMKEVITVHCRNILSHQKYPCAIKILTRVFRQIALTPLHVSGTNHNPYISHFLLDRISKEFFFLTIFCTIFLGFKIFKTYCLIKYFA